MPEKHRSDDKHLSRWVLKPDEGTENEKIVAIRSFKFGWQRLNEIPISLLSCFHLGRGPLFTKRFSGWPFVTSCLRFKGSFTPVCVFRRRPHKHGDQKFDQQHQSSSGEIFKDYPIVKTGRKIPEISIILCRAWKLLSSMRSISCKIFIFIWNLPSQSDLDCRIAPFLFAPIVFLPSLRPKGGWWLKPSPEFQAVSCACPRWIHKGARYFAL